MLYSIVDCGGAQYASERGIPVIPFPKSSKVPDGLSPFDLVTSLRLVVILLFSNILSIACFNATLVLVFVNDFLP